MTRRLWILLALLAILIAELCPAIAHADPIDQTENEAWPLACQTLTDPRQESNPSMWKQNSS
jgi:hypothetical protein